MVLHTRNTAPSPHWWISAPHTPTHQFNLPTPCPTFTVITILAYHLLSPLWSIAIIFAFLAIPLPSSLPICPGLFKLMSSHCVSLPSFQLSALSRFPHTPPIAPFALPHLLFYSLLCPDGCCSNPPLPFLLICSRNSTTSHLCLSLHPLLAPAISPPSSLHSS